MARHGTVCEVRLGLGRIVGGQASGDLERDRLVGQAHQQRGQLRERLAKLGLAGEEAAQLGQARVDVAQAQLEVGDDAHHQAVLRREFTPQPCRLQGQRMVVGIQAEVGRALGEARVALVTGSGVVTLEADLVVATLGRDLADHQAVERRLRWRRRVDDLHLGHFVGLPGWALGATGEQPHAGQQRGEESDHGEGLGHVAILQLRLSDRPQHVPFTERRVADAI